MRKKSVFINCMEALTANRKHSEARTLLNAGLKESAERQTAATAPELLSRGDGWNELTIYTQHKREWSGRTPDKPPSASLTQTTY